jgi:HTH-type transcriptional regulator / antitoxin HipB
MISNERQYAITCSELKKFKASLVELEQKNQTPIDFNEQMRHQLYLDALNSQIDTLKEEIEEYERLKSGTVKILSFDSLEQLPEALIKARIVRGLTQGQLATSLGLKEQQIQQYESTRYANASLSRIMAVHTALNIKIKEEVIFQ